MFGRVIRGYSQSGIGDVTFFCWYNLLQSGNASQAETEKGEKKSEKGERGESKDKKNGGKKGKAGKPPWRFMVGAGVKLPTGESDATELGEYVPAYYQVGSGTTDWLVGISLDKEWEIITFYSQLVYQYVPGRNDIEYRRACRLYCDTGLKFLLHKDTKTKFKAGLSDAYLVDDNWDGLDNSGTLAGPRLGTVKGTKGHYLYGVTGLEISPWENLTMEAGFRLPLNGDDENSEQALDYIVSLGITFKF